MSPPGRPKGEYRSAQHEGTPTSGAASVLLEHVLGIEWADLSDDERSAAKTFLHDTLCVGVAGRNAPGAEGVLATALAWCGTPARGCSILGRPGERATAPYAAFVNAFQIHNQEFDCVHEGAVAHPLATVVAALCAEAERSGPYPGADFLAALVGGVDVVATLGVAATSPLKFFRPATAGIFGTVAALCRLRRFSLADSVSAFGNALAFASGTMQAHLEGRPTLALQVAAAARSAVEAVDLALVGMAGPAASIDGPFGYFALFEDRHDLPAALTTLGKPHRIVELSWKPFPTGRAAHGGLVALQTLQREHGVTGANLRSFVYRAPPLIARLVGRKPFAGMAAAHARLCLPWLGAVTLLHGHVELAQFSAQGLADGAALALAERIGVESDGSENPAAFVPATATAVTRDGRKIVIAVERQLGSPAWRLSADEHFRKARANLAFGGMSDAHEPLLRSIDSLHAASDAAEALSAAFGQGAPC